MKIDLHMHTKKTKEGDSKFRNVSVDKFIEKTKEISIMGITNHNHFDLSQYNEIKEQLKSDQLLWPGVELDISYNDDNTHLILICDDKKVEQFNTFISELITTSEDDFSIDMKILLDKIISKFDNSQIIFFVHYMKAHGVREDTFTKMKTLIESEGYILFAEPSNYATTSIMLNHNINALNGSDVENWDEYTSRDILELKIPIKSFKEFILLTKKNDDLINGYLNQVETITHDLTLGTKKDTDDIKVPIMNEVNVIFGNKGTGKSQMLSELENSFTLKGKKPKLYKSQDNEKEFDDWKDEEIEKCNNLDINSCTEELDFIFNYTENFDSDIIAKIIGYVTEERNKNILTKYPIIGATFSSDYKKETIEKLKKSYATLKDNIEKIQADTSFKVLTESEQSSMESLFAKMLKNYDNQIICETKKYMTDKNITNSIESAKTVLIKKKAAKPKPTNVGFNELVSKRKLFVENSKCILEELNKDKIETNIVIGDLPIKGRVVLNVVEKILKGKGEVKDDGFKEITKLKKFQSELKKLQKLELQDIENYIVSAKKSFKDNSIKYDDLKILIGRKGELQINKNAYAPSKGEKAILLIDRILNSLEYDVYLFDELEQGFENNYMTSIVIPKISKLVSHGKTVVIVTHNANVATHLYPFNTIYREYTGNGYETYFGNMFSDKLMPISNTKENLSWLKMSLDVLEGKEEAFNIRKEIYGL